MAGTSELELKFGFDETVGERLSRAGFDRERPWRTVKLWTTYYDTPDGALAKARVALRVRKTPEGYVQTVKADGDVPFERFEFERPIPGPNPQREALPEVITAVGKVVHRHFEALRALFVTDFERHLWRIQATQSLLIELCIDEGEITAELPGAQRDELGGTPIARKVRWPIRELEMERITGTRLGFLWWALRFAERHQLTLILPTKYDRGLRLCGRLPLVAQPVPSTESPLQDSQTVGQAAASGLRGSLIHLLSNIEPLLLGEDPEAIHQLRVALRRFRAIVRFFGLSEYDARWDAVEQTARTLLNGSNEARDTDVFSLGLLAEVRAAFPKDAALASLVQGAQKVRAQARHRNREVFSGREPTRFALMVLYLCERLALHLKHRPARTAKPTGQPQDPSPDQPPAHLHLRSLSYLQSHPHLQTLPQFQPEPPSDPLAALEDPVRPFALQQLVALWHRLERRLMKARTPRDWHRTRLGTKSLRYAMEIALPALPKPRRVRMALKQLVKLQNRLGEAHDDVVGGAIAHRIAGEAKLSNHETQRATGLIEGWHARAARPASALEATARRIHSRLRKAMAVLS
jgi:inorganic triphosphatase YgiF